MLRGVNRSGFEYSTTAIPNIDLDAFQLWGANVVRLPFNQEWALEDEAYLTTIDNAINGLADRGMYSILDLQWFDNYFARGYDSQGNANYVPCLPSKTSVAAWDKLSARYAANPNVLYDIFNEPHDPLPGDDPAIPEQVTPDVWIPWAIRLVEAIRRNAPDAVILVPGVNWAYDLSAYPIEDLEGVVYSTHVYPNKGLDWDRAFGGLSAVAPVFAGEWGGGDDDLDWGWDLASYFSARNIGWTAWSWTDYPPLTQNGVPTPFGDLVKSLLSPQENA